MDLRETHGRYSNEVVREAEDLITDLMFPYNLIRAGKMVRKVMVLLACRVVTLEKQVEAQPPGKG